MKKILFCSNVISHINAFHLPYMKWFQGQGWKVHVATNGDMELPYCNKKHNISIQRSPFKAKNIKAYYQLKKIFKKENYDIIHCHTPMGGVLARLAACASMKNGTKVVYTAHGFHFFKGAPLQNWLIYYPIEKYLARYTDVLITINTEDFARAKNFKAKRVEYVSGMGVDTEKFSTAVIDRVQKREELGISNDTFVILSVGELNKNKNHEVVIRAIAKLDNLNVQYLICGIGPLESHLRSVANQLGIEKQVKLFGFRNDIAEICRAADIFTFPSKREGLGLAALEAMASGLPIVTSNVHGIVDYSVEGVTGFSCRPYDIDEFAAKMKKLADDAKLRKMIGAHNVQAVKRFDVNYTVKIMKEIYSSVMNV